MTEYVNLFRPFNEEISVKGSFSVEFKKYAKQLYFLKELI